MSVPKYKAALHEIMLGLNLPLPAGNVEPSDAFSKGRAIANKIIELQAKIEALEKDAARWEYAMRANRFGIVNIYNMANGQNAPRTPKLIAEFIDAAINGEQQ